MQVKKILPSYVGAKTRWLNELEHFRGEDFVELFAGSAVISFNLAKTAVLNDLDPYVYKILSRFDELIVPEVFTQIDYFDVRKLSDWWKYSYCLQKMSFSGVFRYSKNGYNVPVKKNIDSISIKEDYNDALSHWKLLQPSVSNLNYLDIDSKIFKDKILILDPPYENANAAYNKEFDYQIFWEFVRRNVGYAKSIIVFEDERNMPFGETQTKNMRVNGSRQGSKESMREFNFDNSLKEGQKAENEFFALYEKKLNMRRADGRIFDFFLKGKGLELKTEFRTLTQTPNYFVETLSVIEQNKIGGPFQALAKGAEYFAFYFIKDDALSIFKTKDLVDYLNNTNIKYRTCDIPNEGYKTRGLLLPRKDVKHLEIPLDSFVTHSNHDFKLVNVDK